MNRRIVPPPQVEIKAAVGAIPTDGRVIVKVEFGAPAHELQEQDCVLVFIPIRVEVLYEHRHSTPAQGSLLNASRGGNNGRDKICKTTVNDRWSWNYYTHVNSCNL